MTRVEESGGAPRRSVRVTQWEEVDRSFLERVAHVMGDCSASAKALREADAMGGDVAFVRSGATILVVNLAPNKPAAGAPDSPPSTTKGG